MVGESKRDGVVKAMAHRCFVLKSVPMIGEGNRIEEV